MLNRVMEITSLGDPRMKEEQTGCLTVIGMHYMRVVLVLLLAICLTGSYVSADGGNGNGNVNGHGNGNNHGNDHDDGHGHYHDDDDSDDDDSDDDDSDDDNGPFPPPGDPSAFGPYVTGDLPDGLPEANEGTFEGGDTGTTADADANNSIPEDEQQDNGKFDVPTNGAPSPLFGAAPFSQQMLRFEEFGTESLNLQNLKRPHKWEPLPAPADAQSSPVGTDLENFLTQGIWPKPTKFANDSQKNLWESQIESYLGRNLVHPSAEGRPSGEGWSHQRWDEFKPVTYFKTAMAGARTNGGFRDSKQNHDYSQGEFGPGGLYHNTVGAPGFDGTTSGINIKFHPSMPVQDHTALWTFDGTLPPKLLKVRYGEPVLMRHHNALPIDVAANRGFGVHTITTHEHNGHSPAESDGYANAFFFPGQFYDYRWPIPLAGHDSINTDASDPKAGTPDGHGGIKRIPGDYRETMSTHWFHDHMLDFTAQNVYKGNAAMMNYYSAIDRGNEGIDDGVNLRLPSGTALDWGNRDYDVNLLIAEKAWDTEGQLWFNPFNLKGFIGDVMTVNWLYKPYLDVRARRYRFRLLNGSVSRYFKIALVDGAGERVPFHMVANDGNLMEHTVYFENGELPTQGIAERYDIIVDFSQFADGDKLYFVNLLQHKNGQATDVPIPLEDVLSGAYNPNVVGSSWVDGDPVVGKFLEFKVHNYEGEDLSMDPADFVVGKQKMIPLRRPTEDELANAVHRTFEFEGQPTDDKPWVIETDGAKGFGMDPRRLSAAPSKNASGLEVWRILNSGTWSHPVHIHFEEGIVLRRDSKEPPEWEKWARKDVYRIGPQSDSGAMVEIALRFREFAGSYMEHCHNTQHEDHAMLLRWDIEHPGQVKLMPAPLPSWDGVTYVDTVALPAAREGDGVGEFGPSLDNQAVQIWVDGVEVETWDLDGNPLDMVDFEIGDAVNPTEDERVVLKVPLRKGMNIDSNGNMREVFFVLHDVSDEELAEEMGLAWAGGLSGTPEAATSEATFDGTNWIFMGDLPNPITFMGPQPQRDMLNAPIPAQSADNTYTPLRRVTIDGKDVLVNAFFIKWGDEFWEQLRVDVNCAPDSENFPDDPPNTRCRYNGENWGVDSAHALDINTTVVPYYVKMKGHKSWVGDLSGGDYQPYYLVVDSFPAGPANNMGVPYVPKHAFLGSSAVPLVQFMPPAPLSGGFPPAISNTNNVGGGGPMGGQIGLPTYFMPEDNYTPFWHIGFTNWLVDPLTDPEVVASGDGRVIKGIERLKQLRADGKIEIREWPMFAAVDTPGDPDLDGNGIGDVSGLPRTNSYRFEHPAAPHVVNCPTPVTIDFVVHGANKMDKAAQE